MNIIFKNNNIKTTAHKLIIRKTRGFSGITHVLIAIMLLFLLLYLDIPFSIVYKSLFMNNWKFVIVAFFTIAGAALLPDLDSPRSTARYQLKLLGTLLKTALTSLSYLTTSIFRMKNDWVPKTQHRCLFHTPFIGILIGFLFWIFIPNSQVSYLYIWRSAVETSDYSSMLVDNISIHICVFLAFCCIYLGVNILAYRILRIFPRTVKRFLPFATTLLCFWLLLNFSFAEIKYIGVSISLGYLFHIFGDLFTEGSVPIIWPIPVPWKKQWWWRPRGIIFGRIKTGGMINFILNYVLIAVNLFLGYIIFIKGFIN